MKYGNLNFLEPSGPLQACNGTALALLYVFTLTKYYASTGYEINPLVNRRLGDIRNYTVHNCSYDDS